MPKIETDKLVSVIIPTYSRTKYLARAIDSVLNQTYANVEVIVVDDNEPNSIDRKNNEEIMKRYLKNRNVKYLKHEKNMNGATARNTGIRNSKGYYITFLDDDDFYLKERISKCVNVLQKSKSEGVYTGTITIKGNRIINVLNTIGSGNFIELVLSQKSFIGTGSNLFFTRKAIDNIGFFDESFIRHQDLEYLVRYFEKYDIDDLNESLVVKCQDDRKNELNINKSIFIREKFLERFKKNIKESIDPDDIYYKNYFSLLILSLYCKKYKISSELLKVCKKYKNLDIKDYVKIIYGFLNGFIDLKKFVLYFRNSLKVKQLDTKIVEEIKSYGERYE